MSLRVVRSRAPLRLSFAGGGTDVAPYPERWGGAVTSATINRYAHCSIRESSEDSITVRSLDMNEVTTFGRSAIPTFDGNLDLIKAVFRRLNVPCVSGMSVVIHVDAPPGSGLGSSSALVVSVIAALSTFFHLDLGPADIARAAYVVERQDLGISGGAQDQYAAAFGGCNFIEFTRSVEVLPLRISLAMRCELESHLLLCYTGRTRLSSGILDRQVDNVLRSEPATMGGLARLKELATEIRRSLHDHDLARVAALLDDGWVSKKELAPGIADSALDTIHDVAKRSGALGGKLLGAGGGGYFLFLVEPDHRNEVVSALAGIGVSCEPAVQLTDQGVVAWEAPQRGAELHPAFARSS